ncbi:hypothetical protein Cri9333_0978 [Crinalium epipsammum PCC 9333]|uniref:Uncharacterized protein n=1 Tax=Crinalium epipsammum PCC 9333 TaxID=1173022 RepID=K9VUV6_9CYAN|nr:hypothetical protein Cri9333_0978 [Crinalium epipsammum PCC 9333]
MLSFSQKTIISQFIPLLSSAVIGVGLIILAYSLAQPAII